MNKEPWRCAVHEAGHALVMFAVGHPFTSVEVHHVEDHWWGVTWTEAEPANADEFIMVALGGLSAEKVLIGEPDYEKGRSDLNRMHSRIWWEGILDPTLNGDEFQAAMVARAMELVHEQEHVLQILAGVLNACSTITGDQARDILKTHWLGPLPDE